MGLWGGKSGVVYRRNLARIWHVSGPRLFCFIPRLNLTKQTLKSYQLFFPIDFSSGCEMGGAWPGAGPRTAAETPEPRSGGGADARGKAFSSLQLTGPIRPSARRPLSLIVCFIN